MVLKLFTSNPISKKLFGQLAPYSLPFLHPLPAIRKLVLRSYGFLLCSKALFISGPLCLKHGIDAVSAGDKSAYLLFILYGVSYTGSTFFQGKRNVISTEINQQAVQNILVQTYRHILTLDPQFHNSQSTRTRIFNLYKAQQAIDQNLRSLNQFFIPIILDLVSGLGMLFANCGIQFCGVFLCFNVLYSVFTIKYSQHRRKQIGNQRQHERKTDHILNEALSNYYNIKYFQSQQIQAKKYHDALAKLFNSTRINHLSLGYLNTGQRLIFSLGVTLNLMMGVHGCLSGTMTAGDIVLMQSLMMQMLGPLFFLGVTYRSWFESLIDIQQLYKITQIQTKIKQPASQTLSLPSPSSIEFRDVAFRYSTQTKHQLKSFNLQIQPEQFVAIMGRSGAGKSTLISLIYRLVDPSQGQILFGGKSLRQLKFSQFRDKITVMTQYNYIANQSIEYNLLYGTGKTLQDALVLTKQFKLHQKIELLEQGYGSFIGDKGSKLSGGERQRVCLIRALLRPRQIMIFDEPTTGLDQQMEQRVVQHLRGLKGTRVVITHNERVSECADRVVYIDRS